MVGKFYKDGAYNTIGSQMVIAEQEFIATADQTLFTLTTGTYTPGANRLAIFVNGTRQPQTAYTESSSTTFTMASGLEAGDKILAQILSFNETAIGAAHGSTHKPGGGDAIGLIVADVGGSNRNLLHNWDFKQPVNLLGASSYTTSGTSIATISRWRINTGTLTVNSGYVTTTTGSIFFQMMPEAWVKRFLGKTLTLTLEKSDGTILSGTITLPLANPEVFTEYYAINSGGIAFSTTLGVSGSPTHFQFFRLTNTTGADLSIKRVKLEVGSASTLVNDPPADYFEQISLCQTISDSIPAFQGGYGSNKNILHNWDLRNPVNQRAASSYSGASGSYTIDRWRISYDGVKTLSVQSGYIQYAISTLGTWSNFEQVVERVEAGVYTLSFLVDDTSKVNQLYAGNGGTWYTGPVTIVGNIISRTFTFPSAIINTLVVGIQMKETVSNALKIYAAKLELGPFSTLANDPSADFGEQLRYCQRFYEKSYNIGVAPGTSTDAGCVEVFTPAYMAANYATVNCSFKVEKRTTPTVTVYSITGATNCWRNTSTAADQSCGWGREGTSKFFTWVGSPAINNEYEFQWVAQCDL